MREVIDQEILVLQSYENPDDSRIHVDNTKYPLVLLCPTENFKKVENNFMAENTPHNEQFNQSSDSSDQASDKLSDTEYENVIKHKNIKLLFQPKRIVVGTSHVPPFPNHEKAKTNNRKKTKKSGRPHGGEVTIKYRNPNNGEFESPQGLIDFAENHVSASLIQMIGYEVLSQVSSVVKKLERARLINGPIGINVSHRQFENPNFIENMRRMLHEENVKPSNFEIEVTESAKPGNLHNEGLQLARAHYYGIKRAADDVGEGYHSMEFLNNKYIKYGFDTVKISYTKISKISEGLNNIKYSHLYIENGNALSSDPEVQFYLDLIKYAVVNGCDVVLEGVKNNDDLILLYKTAYRLKNSIINSVNSQGVRLFDEWREISINAKQVSKYVRSQIEELNIQAQQYSLQNNTVSYNYTMDLINSKLFELQHLDRLHHRGKVYKGESVKPVISVQSYDNDIPKDILDLLKSTNRKIFPALGPVRNDLNSHGHIGLKF